MMYVRWLRAHASLVWLAALALAAIGAVSIFRLPSGIYPEMTFPRVIVVAHAGQLAPDLVEAQVTRPLEQALAVVPGVRYVRAKTIRGAVEVSLQLVDNADPLQVQYACQTAVDHVDLPHGTTTIVQRVLPTSVPVVTYNLSAAPSGHADTRRLRDVAERIVRPALVRVPGIGAVDLVGGRVRQMQILIKPAELAALHLTPSDLAKKIEQADQVVAAGRVFDEHQTLPVVLDAQAADVERLRLLPIAQGPEGPITLSAVADVPDGSTVAEGAEDPDVIVRGPRGEAVAISIARLPGASTPAVVRGVHDAVAALRLPSDVVLEPVYDQAELVDDAMASVRDAILVGIALSLLVIAVSLRDWRAGLVAALPVPLTLLGTFAVMRWLGVTLNLMSLGGLAVSIGLVVDDAIVVTEGIVRRLEDGHEVHEAVELGTRDMLAAVVGTTCTTVLVFAPLALLTGVTGHFLGALAVTLVIAVLLSMAMSLTLIPVLADRLRHHRKPAHEPAPSADPGRVDRAISWLVHRRFVALGLVVALFGAGALAERSLATGFLPQMDEGAFVVDFFLPAGTSLEETDRVALAIDEVLRTTPEVVTFTRRTGSELGPATATMQSRGDIMVRLVPHGQRDHIRDVIARVRERVHAAVPEARVEYVQLLQDVLADLSGNPAPIEVRVLGDDPQLLEQYARAANDKLDKLGELVDFFDGVEGKTPILRSRVDPLQVARLGLGATEVGDDLQIAIAGREVAQVIRPERTIGVRLRYPDAIRFDPGALARSPIAYGPKALPLGEIVTFDRPLSPAVLRRDGLRPAILMTAAAKTGDLGGAEVAIRSALRDVPLPRGTQLEIGGQAAAASAARLELVTVALVATVLVLLVLLVQLQSLRLALVVLIGAPLSTVGALLVLAATGLPLDVSSMTGLVLLVGLVVKNGILLLEHARRGMADGLGVEAAIVAAARRRLRPVLMTTAATLAGLAPLAFGIGAGAELQRPLAVAVIGGLTLATAVTLVVTPGLTMWIARKTS